MKLLEDVAELERSVSRSRSHPRGKMLFRADEPFRAIYVARSGAVKTYLRRARGCAASYTRARY